jgi:sulfite reductase (NADPH) flavoprotein alpha-component
LEGSEKETRHYEFSLAGSGLRYEVGDSMGVFAQNNPQLVQELLDALHFSGDEQVKNRDGETVSIRERYLLNFLINNRRSSFWRRLRNRAAPAIVGLMDPDRKPNSSTISGPE